jgi:hypothetical protein
MTTKNIKWPQNVSNGRKIDLMDIKYTNIFHYKTLQNLSKLGFFVWKQTIWHPWSEFAFQITNNQSTSCFSRQRPICADL